MYPSLEFPYELIPKYACQHSSAARLKIRSRHIGRAAVTIMWCVSRVRHMTCVTILIYRSIVVRRAFSGHFRMNFRNSLILEGWICRLEYHDFLIQFLCPGRFSRNPDTRRLDLSFGVSRFSPSTLDPGKIFSKS